MDELRQLDEAAKVTGGGGLVAAIYLGIRSLEALIGRMMFQQRAGKTMDDISKALNGMSAQLKVNEDLTRKIDKSLEIFIEVQKHRG